MKNQIYQHKEQLREVIEALMNVQTLILNSCNRNQHYSSTHRLHTIDNLKTPIEAHQ